MRILNETKTQVLENPDLQKGYLKSELLITHHEARPEIKQVSHYVLVREYPNGGKAYNEVIDVPYQAARAAYEEKEPVYVYVPYTEQEKEQIELNKIRQRRSVECFSVINRGMLWYEKLSAEQKEELLAWYEAWLDAPATKICPERLEWVDTAL